MNLKIPEKQIENSILSYLRAKRILAWKNQSTGIYDSKRKVYRKPNNRHHINGVSDILGVFNGQFLAIEVKSIKGRVTKAQEQFIEDVNNSGGIAFVARSIEDVKKILG